jgi:hypothetical protein
LPIQIFYSNVLKARVFSNSELPSLTATSSYLFGISHTTPVLSVITDNDNLYGNTGIFTNWQFDWQKDAYAEYFDTTNQLIFSQRAAMQVDGGAGGSRSHPQHSFRLEFDNSVLGDGSINYPLIPNRSSRSNDAANTPNYVGNSLSDSLGSFTAGVANAAYNTALYGIPSLIGGLFGRKETRSVKVVAKESGWSIVKTWAQPEFDIIRYAIGIKDIGVSQFEYANVSEMISKPWASPKEIVKVRLIADQFIPPEYPTGNYIEYYIQPAINDDKWIRINPVELPTVFPDNNPTKPVPRIISFNSERPVSSKEEESYLLTSEPVTSLRLKIIIKRPADSAPTSTPIVRSYRILMTPKGGL